MPAELHQAMRYSCLAPGKRIRPALCMACAEACGASGQAVIDAACAIEIVHAFSLIHDDLPAIDDDALRRGQPSNHVRFGESIAILAGDALFSLAFETLSRSPHEPELVVKAMQILTKAAGSDGLVGGEVVDVQSEGEPVDPERLHYIHSRKTGALMAAACETGATLAGATDASKHKRYGELLGLAFQIADDILNETADPRKLGKAVGSDKARRKATYTALYGLDQARLKASETAHEAEELAGSPFLKELAQFTIERLH